jgi:hypothetical protein
MEFGGSLGSGGVGGMTGGNMYQPSPKPKYQVQGLNGGGFMGGGGTTGGNMAQTSSQGVGGHALFGAGGAGNLTPGIGSSNGLPVSGVVGGGGGGGSGSGGMTGGNMYQPPPPATTIPATGGLTLTTQPSPEMQAAQAEWKKRMDALQGGLGTADPNLQSQIDEYKKRLGADDTQRATDRAASAIRDQMSGMSQRSDQAGAATGRGQGFGATGIAEAGQRALAGQSADIQLGQQQRLDNLVLGGQGIMGAPGQRDLQYQSLLNGMYGQNPYAQTAQLGLQQQGLGLQAYLGQLQAQNDQARTNADIYGSPWKMYQLLYGGGF